jgi:hypothetical protein
MTECSAVDAAGLDREANDSTGELIYDHKDPVSLQLDGLAAE